MTLNSDSAFATKEELEVNERLNASTDPAARELYNLINYTCKKVMHEYDGWQYVYFAKRCGMSEKALDYVHQVIFSKYVNKRN